MVSDFTKLTLDSKLTSTFSVECGVKADQAVDSTFLSLVSNRLVHLFLSIQFASALFSSGK